MLRLFLPLGVLAFIVATLLTGSHLLEPGKAPDHVRPTAALGNRLARHLLFVVVDGLRYDIANNAELMPNFARAMQQHVSAEVWAGRVSMTSSAIMAFGTGQPGRAEQVVKNLIPAPPRFNSWLENARSLGLELASVGDPGWVEMYGKSLAASRVDPEGVAIDADFNPHTFRDARALVATRPDFLVVHFVTPDHQGHAYGIQSDRYREHVRGFDRDLDAFLSELDGAWTVVVTSDHGAADSGTHGTDVPIQRRCPIYAYGPGIAAGASTTSFDQLDVAPTLAFLLGVPPPAHGRGRLMTEWLDLEPEERALAQCRQAEGALRYARSLDLPPSALEGSAAALRACATSAEAPLGALEEATAGTAIRGLDDSLEAASEQASFRGGVGVVFVVLGAFLLVMMLLGVPSLGTLGGALVVLGASTYLVYQVERWPSYWPNVARALVFTLVNAPLVALLLRPGVLIGWLEKTMPYVAVVVPGMLVTSYTPNTKAESMVVLLVLGFVFLVFGMPNRTSGALSLARIRSVPGRELLLFVAIAAVLYPVLVAENDFCPRWLREEPFREKLAASLGLLVWQFGGRAERPKWPRALLGVGVLLLVLWGRPWMPPWLGRSIIVGFGLAAIALARRGETELAQGLGLTSFLAVARPFEVVFLVATLMMARLVVRATLRTRSSAVGFAETLLFLTFAFALLYVQRAAIHNGLDLGAADYGAGAFGDPAVSAWVVTSSLVYKFVLAQVVTCGVLAQAFERPLRERLATALVVVCLGRAAALLALLYACGGSYWTALRLVADLPFALVALLGALLFWLGLMLASAPRHAPAFRFSD